METRDRRGEPIANVAVAMLGARMHYAVPRLLYDAGLLERFFTDSYVGNKPWLEKALRAIPVSARPQGLTRWLGRKDDLLPAEKVTSFELLGLWYSHALKQASDPMACSQVSREAAGRFNRRILQAGLGEAQVVWGFNGASAELFAAAKPQGRHCIVEQTSLPRQLERQLLAEEQCRWPGWEKKPTNWSQPSALDGREEGEWELADIIVAGSDFVRDGLLDLGVSPDKVRVVPYGVDAERFPIKHVKAAPAEGPRPLRVLFAGAVGLRKGVPDLLHALSSIQPGQIEARLAGGIQLKPEKLQPFRAWAEFLGPVPRLHMAELFQWADVFVLPSIVEGSATVTYEALMSGCAVIATPNAGSIVRHGEDGFIVPIRSPDLLAEALRRYVEDRALLSTHQQNLQLQRERAGLERYKRDLVRVVGDMGRTNMNAGP